MNLTFDEFMKACDKELAGLGWPMGVEALPDAMWRDYYDDGMCVIDALQTANDDHWDNQFDCLFYG